MAKKPITEPKRDPLKKTADERLWEILEAHRQELDLDNVDINKVSPIEILIKQNPEVSDYIEKARKETNTKYFSIAGQNLAIIHLLADNMNNYNRRKREAFFKIELDNPKTIKRGSLVDNAEYLSPLI